MGVKYTDKTQKTYLRSRVKEFVLRFIDMSKAFTEYNFTETMYPIIKGCTSYMNRQVLATSGIQWTRHVTQHVIHSIFEDTRRNEGSKEKSAAKRKEKRALAVSLETSAFSKALFLLTRNHMQVGSSSSSQVLESSQPEEPLVASTSQVGENKSGLYERTTSLGLDTRPPASSEFDLDQGLTPQAASYPAAIFRKQRDPNNPPILPSRVPFGETRRNEGSKEKSTAKRKEKRALAVRLETSAFSKALFLLTRNHMQVGSSSSQVLESSQPEESSLEASTSQVGENKSGLYERTTSLGLDTHPPVRSEFDLNQGLTPQAASYPAAISRKRRDPNNPLFPPSRAPNTREKSTSSLTPHHSASSKKHDDFKRRSRPQETLTKVLLPPGVVKVIPMSGILQYPPFYVVLGSPWNILFVNLTMWLPELNQIDLADQDSVMIQYKTDNGWKPLAGDEQLNVLLSEFSLSKSDLHLRCAPESEFRSGPNSELDSEPESQRKPASQKLPKNERDPEDERDSENQRDSQSDGDSQSDTDSESEENSQTEPDADKRQESESEQEPESQWMPENRQWEDSEQDSGNPDDSQEVEKDSGQRSKTVSDTRGQGHQIQVAGMAEPFGNQLELPPPTAIPTVVVQAIVAENLVLFHSSL